MGVGERPGRRHERGQQSGAWLGVESAAGVEDQRGAGRWLRTAGLHPPRELPGNHQTGPRRAFQI